MTAIRTGFLGEQTQRTELSNGLTVITVKKPGFIKKAGLLAVGCGSDNTRPPGVAHFLEHKMFDMPDGRNVLQMYGELGASPNAFTSHSLTAYHFETTERFDECLSLLLEYVFTPYYTEESVEKEQGIIGQELSMYRDMPQMRLFDELLALAYTEHGVRIPIGGTHESIRGITKDILYECHERFYMPPNMVLCVAGDVEHERVAELAYKLTPQSGKGAPPDVRPCAEPESAGGHELTVDMDVPLPLFGVAVKLKQPGGVSHLEWEVRVKLASECLAGMSSPLYSKLYEDGLIDSGFGFDPFLFDGGGCLLFIGQSREPAAVRGALLDEAERLMTYGVPPELYQRVSRSLWGTKLRVLDSPLGLARQVAANHLAGSDFFSLPEVFKSARKVGAEDVFGQIKCDRTAMVVLKERKECS